MEIRKGTSRDLEQLTKVEAECFPPAEAAGKEALAARLAAFADHFYLLWDADTLAGFVNGMASDSADLLDEMYADASLHDENGAWQMIFGLDVIAPYRRRGCAEQLMRALIGDAREQGRHGVVLTCKPHMLHYYARLGFADEGICASQHGGVQWHQMRLTF